MLGWVDCASQDDGTSRRRRCEGHTAVKHCLGPRRRTGDTQASKLDGVAVAVAAARSSHQQLLRPRWMTTGAHENRVAVQPWGPRQPCSSGLSPFELARMPSCCTDRRKNLGLRPLLGLDVTREPHGQECSVGSSQSLRTSERMPADRMSGAARTGHSRPIKTRRPNSVTPALSSSCKLMRRKS